jgi:cytochrome P450
MAREILRDVQFGDYLLPAGGVVFVAPYVLHRHPKLWDDPQSFRPERFAPEQENAHHKYQYIPFGGGEHICIGNSYAMLEAALVLATLARRFHLQLPAHHSVRERALVTLMPDQGLPMMIEQRQAVPV